MWKIESPSIRKSSLDFSGSGGPRKYEVSQLVSGHVLLVNALELVEWDPERTQVLVCEQCGMIGCAPGGWINVRQAASRIFLIPAFADIEADAESKDHYRPPEYLRKEGAAYFDIGDYLTLVEAHLEIPPISAIHPLELGEAARLFQRAAPFRMFGETPAVVLDPGKSDSVVGSSKGDPSANLGEIEKLLRSYYESKEPALLRDPRPDEEIIHLFVDAAEFIDWPALIETQSGYRLLLENEFVIDLANLHQP